MKKSIRKILFSSIFVLFGVQFSQAQFFKKYVYTEGELGVISSFFVTNSEGEAVPFALGGLSLRGGLGVHDEENNLFLGIYSGFEGNFRHSIGILPVYLNSKLALNIADDKKLFFSFGYGRSFQMGPENLSGYLKKYSIAYGRVTSRENIQSFFIEIDNHGYNFPDDGISVVTLNFGLTYTFL
ncbi:hypothetical protein SAMN06265349_102216 [Flavobacterium resistens]|uniref:Outer membrane protein beta-barrel domain-containing protein n=1 Tax=Flavobacterium resistens TaxID=443612 RepID=A0A521C7C4_9FLAO|nr:hypothetical protein [Flavobacterium resistens]MRX69574.1 hypothetical protein [Flavobacterium resistens]SMO54610.1 hypothetical protein SAMN06265349_102216 [Flavobacterium resistens]